MAARELRAGPRGQLTRPARLEADAEQLPDALPFGNGRDTIGRRDRLSGGVQDLESGRSRLDARRSPLEDPQPDLGLEPLERV